MSARLAQGQDVRIFGIDQDEDEEYTEKEEEDEGPLAHSTDEDY